MKDENGITRKDWTLTNEAISCALSVDRKASPMQSESNALIALYTVFMSDLNTIKPGSRIIIDGQKYQSGLPHIYPGSHQEIPVELDERA